MLSIFLRSIGLFFALILWPLAEAAEKHDLAVDTRILAQAKQLGGQNSANFRALFGLSLQEDLQKLRSITDKNGVTHTRYRQTLQGVPVWGEQMVVSRDSKGNIVGLHGSLVTGLAAELRQLQPALTAAEALNAMKGTVRKNYSQS
ncbi:MAG: hypothetical protein ACU83O_15220, partial [Gammaproteobacteria bacterium]